MRPSKRQLKSTARPSTRSVLMVLLIVFAVMLPSSSFGEESKPVPCLGPVQLSCEDARNIDALIVGLEAELAAAKVPPPPKDCGDSNTVAVAAVSAALGVLAGVLTVILVQ